MFLAMRVALAAICIVTLLAVAYLSMSLIVLRPPRANYPVWFALAGPSETRTKLSHFRGDRGQVRMMSAFAALQLVREATGAPAVRNAFESSHAAPPGKT